MEQYLLELFARGSTFLAAILMAVCLHLVIHAVKDLRQGHPEGFLYLTLAIFLGVGQFVAFEASTEMQTSERSMILPWAFKVFIPALLSLFFFRSLVAFALGKGREGLVKTFFGVTLVCFLYMLGDAWPVDVKLILACLWIFFLFKSELSIAT